MAKPLSEVECKLAAKLLKLAGDEFANHSCNDFDLVRNGGLTKAEAKELAVKIQEWDGNNDEGYYADLDWLLMDYLAWRLNGEEKVE